jgi:lipid II:glycine glycyltransferase (peptidoglycan interpeptide bridge formation enzyme)
MPGVPYTMMYAPRGPVCDVHDKETIMELTKKVKEPAKKHKAYVMKIDPDVSVEDKEFMQIMSECGYKLQKTGNNFEGIQPKFVFRLNVEGKTEDEIFAQFHTENRRKIRIARDKSGVEVKIGTREDLPEFHKIMVETGLRDEFVVRTLDYFEKMYDCFAPENLRLYCAYLDGKMIAGTIAILYGDKVWYLYGASSNDNRKAMPNYLLQWEMIRWSIEAGCKIYDFRGVSGDISEDNPLYGLYRFKKGFCPEITEFIGDFYYIYNPLIYNAMEFAQKLRKKLRKGH